MPLLFLHISLLEGAKTLEFQCALLARLVQQAQSVRQRSVV